MNRPRADREYLRGLHAQVAGWDPLGLIALGAPEDEYDCLLAPLVSGLRDGLPPRELAGVLRDRVIEHFGGEPAGAYQFAVQIDAWHRSLPRAPSRTDAR